MATQVWATDFFGGQNTTFESIVGSANLKRHRANGSNYVSRGQCEGAGLGYTFVDNGTQPDTSQTCYFPCPDAYTISATDPAICEPRPLLTKVEIYYGILAQAVKDCATLIPAYKDAVAEANNDPSQVGFPTDSGCVNPFDPPPPPPVENPPDYVPPEQSGLPNPTGDNNSGGNEGNYDPYASNGDPLKPADVPPQTDPNGSSGQAGQQNGGIDGATGEPFIPTIPDGTKQEPYIPDPPPAYREIDEYDESGVSTTLPRGRLMVTDDEIAQLPKVNDYGTMTDGDLALRLKAHPTLLDAQPAYLPEFIAQVPSFVYECSITQAEFDLLPDDWKCRLCGNYENTIYGNPSNIAILRGYAPTITMTRTAPQGTPSFVGCPQETKKSACESQTGYNRLPCSYSGGCNGECVCPQAPADKSDAYGDMPTDTGGDNTALYIAGGAVLVAFLLLR